MRRGLVIKLVAGIYTVMDLETQEEILCKARGKLRKVKLDKNSSFLKSKSSKTKVEAQSIRLSPKVGDYVYFLCNEGNYIMEIDERKNELERPDIANIDQAILVFAAKEPVFSSVLLDRFLAIIERENITPVIIITKMDLLSFDEKDEMYRMMDYYKKLYKVFYTSSKMGLGVNELNEIFRDKISVFTGQTGVGKTSLLNALDSNLNLETQEISQALGRGKHTTRHTELYKFRGGMIADTPGFGSLDYGNMTFQELNRSFPEFFLMSEKCKFRECLHINEPGCKVILEYKNGNILKSRYENYVRFYNEIKERKRKY